MLMMPKSSVLVSASKWSCVLVYVSAKYGHWCGACHGVFDAKVSTKKSLENNTENQKTYECFLVCLCTWFVVV